METPASSSKLRANAPEGRKRFPISLPDGDAANPVTLDQACVDNAWEITRQKQVQAGRLAQ
jgi:hypothetical protein